MLASILFALLPLVSAIVTPTTPDGSTVINEGASIDAVWTADTTGEWTNMTIQLMTGDNLSMIPLRTLISGVDGTTTTTFSTPAPDVEPNSKIYFLQFTNGNDPTATWTTRFTIAAADGTTTEPEQTTNYNGEDVQWGVGAIVGESTGSNSTTPSSGTGAGAGMASSVSMSASAAASTSTGSGITNYGPSSSGSAIANPSNVSGPSRASSASEQASATVSQAASSASTSPNAAAAFAPHVAVGGLVGIVGVVMGLVL